MSETKPNPILVRTFTTTSPIRACRLRRDDLKRLYRIINDPLEQFQERRVRVANSFTTTVNVTGTNQEVVTGQQESFFDTTNIPDNILTVFYTTMAGPAEMGLAPQ